MTEKRKVKGLLDLLAVDPNAEGIDWEWDRLAFGPDNMGLGLGATENAKRWAWIGYNVEIRSRIDAKTKRPRGRPKKGPTLSRDAYRAFQCWRYAQIILSKYANAEFTNRQLIAIARDIEDRLNIPSQERAFRSGSFDQSVTRGRKILGIDKSWHSEICEEIEAK